MNKQTLQSLAKQAQEESIFVKDTIVPFPISKVKVNSKQSGTGDHKNQADFFKISTQQVQAPITEFNPQLKSARTTNQLNLGAEVNNLFNTQDPDGPSPAKLYIGQKPKRINDKENNTIVSQNLENEAVADIGQVQTAIQPFYQSRRFTNKKKVTKPVYKSTDLFKREQGYDFRQETDEIDHLKTRDGDILGEPFIKTPYLQSNEGLPLRLDPKIEFHRKKTEQARIKQEQQRIQDKLEAQKALSMKSKS